MEKIIEICNFLFSNQYVHHILQLFIEYSSEEQYWMICFNFLTIIIKYKAKIVSHKVEILISIINSLIDEF
jgi:hypothetical protein